MLSLLHFGAALNCNSDKPQLGDYRLLKAAFRHSLVLFDVHKAVHRNTVL